MRGSSLGFVLLGAAIGCAAPGGAPGTREAGRAAPPPPADAVPEAPRAAAPPTSPPETARAAGGSVFRGAHAEDSPANRRVLGAVRSLAALTDPRFRDPVRYRQLEAWRTEPMTAAEAEGVLTGFLVQTRGGETDDLESAAYHGLYGYNHQRCERKELPLCR